MKKALFLYITLCLATITFAAAPLKAGYHQRGKTYYVYRKYDRAKEMFLKVVEKYEHGDSYYFLGEIEKIQKNYPQAEKYFSRAAELTNTNRKYRKNAFWNMIVLAEQRGNLDDVVRACKKMWATLHDSSARQKVEKLINKFLWTENTEAIKEFKKGTALKKRKKIDEAIKHFQSAISTDSSFLAPKFELSLIYYKRGDYSSAASYLREITGRISFYAEAHLMLGDIYFHDKSYSYARDHFIKALDFSFSGKSTTSRITWRIAEASYAARDYKNAADYAEKALKLRRNSLKALLILSASRIKMDDYDGALKALRRAARIKPGSPLILYQTGSLYYRQKDDRYIRYFDRLFNLLSPEKRKSSRYRRAFHILAKSHFEKKQYKRVVTITGAFPGESRNFEMTLIRGKSLYRLRRYDKSIDILETISLAPRDAALLCRAYALSRRKEKAKAMLLKYRYSDEFNDEADKSRILSRLKKEIEREKKLKEKHEQEEKEKKEREKKKKIEELKKKRESENREIIEKDTPSR